jgi:class 3 adenylate cyclase
MEPRIQYAKTRDGVNIAYWTLGEGEPLVMPPAPASPSLRAWETPEGRRFFELVARNRQLIRFDSRGIGQSKDGPPDYSFDSVVTDLDAVVDHLGLERFALFGSWHGAIHAIAYAAHHSDRVTQLVLCNGAARGEDYFAMTRFRTVREALDADPGFLLDVIAHQAFGWTGGEQAKGWVAALGEDVDRDQAIATIESAVTADLASLLPLITAPTLVIHRRRLRFPSLDAGRSLAAQIPNARLVILEGESATPYIGDIEPVAQAIAEFLGDPLEEPEGGLESSRPEGMTAILFLDIADSTALTTKLGDAAYREKERELDSLLRTAITDAGGTPLEGKLLGDGILSVYASAKQAIDAAQRCRDIGNQAGLPLHLGIHAGDVIHEENDVRGGAVQLAARVQSMAATGEILVSDIVRGLARTSAGVAFEDRGEHELKGIDEPQRIYAVRAD